MDCLYNGEIANHSKRNCKRCQEAAELVQGIRTITQEARKQFSK